MAPLARECVQLVAREMGREAARKAELHEALEVWRKAYVEAAAGPAQEAINKMTNMQLLDLISEALDTEGYK